MKSMILEIVSGMGILIAVFLFLNNADATVSIIKQLGSSSTGMVRTLQGK